MKTIMKTVCLLLFLVFCINANAETYVFVGHSYPLLLEETKDGDFSGLAADIARTITKKLGHSITIRLYPWARAQYMVRNGEADVLMPPYKTPERETWLDFTESPFHTDKTFFYIRADSTWAWDGEMSSLRGKVIGMCPGWSFGAKFERSNDISIDFAPTIDLTFRKLLAKRVDIVPTQPREADASFRRLGLTEKQKPRAIHPKVAENHHYFGFSRKKRKELSVFKKDFDLMLNQMKKNGDLARLLKKYGLSDL